MRKRQLSTLETGINNIDIKIKKYGREDKDKPPYVIVGLIKLPNKRGWQGGVLAFSNNEVYAHILRKELSVYGDVSVERTYYHPQGETYSIEAAKIIDKLMSS